MMEDNNFQRQAGQVQKEISNALAAIDPAEVARFIQTILDAGRIFLAGKGRTGLQMQAFAMRLMHLGLDAHVIGEISAPGVQPGALLIIGSASGKTGSLVAFAQAAVDHGAKVAAITANRESVIAKTAVSHVFIPAPSHKKQRVEGMESVLPMGGLFESTLGVALNVFVLQLMRELGVTEAEMATRHANLE